MESGAGLAARVSRGLSSATSAAAAARSWNAPAWSQGSFPSAVRSRAGEGLRGGWRKGQGL